MSVDRGQRESPAGCDRPRPEWVLCSETKVSFFVLNAAYEQFLQHLKYERGMSPHTLRNYASDLEQ
ncbi:MAG TPA: hypothetical protein DEP46_05750, partial [Blastocatellia bacterium]|nr:hypothetical protein [Blastocatellia bacterium]